MIRKTIKMNYLTFHQGYVDDVPQELFEEACYNSLFYKMMNKHFNMVYEPNKPDFVFHKYHYSHKVDKNVPSIVFHTEEFLPNFNIYDYGMSYSDIQLAHAYQDRYVRFPAWIYWYDEYVPIDIENSIVHQIPQISKEHAKKLLAKKTRFCTFVQSNLNLATLDRVDFFHQLNEYKQVSSGGRTLNNTTITGSKHDFQLEGKFAMTFENTSKNYYITEKIIEALVDKTIPIYWGSPNISEEMNSHAFVNCHEYKSFNEVIEQIKEIDNNDDLWCEMMSIKEKIYADKATQILRNMETFFYNIFSQDSKSAKKVLYKSETIDTHRIWGLKNKYHLSNSSLEKTAKVLGYKKKKNIQKEG